MIYDKYVEISGNVFWKAQKIGGAHQTSGAFQRRFEKSAGSLSEEWRDGIESETRVSGLLKGSQKELGVVSDVGSGDRIFHYI